MENTGGSEKPWTDKDVLRELYVNRELPATTIGERLGCSHRTILNWVERFGFEKHTSRPTRPSELQDASWVFSEYVEKGRSAAEIGDSLGCTPHTVLKAVREHGYEEHIQTNAAKRPDELDDPDWLREHYSERLLTMREIASELGCHYSTVRDAIHEHDIDVQMGPRTGAHEPLRDADLLRELHDQGLGARRIAEELGVSSTSVGRWLHKHGIQDRSGGAMEGENHHSWNGGVGQSAYYGKSWGPQRQKALERDEYTCRLCGLPNDEHVEQHGRALDVHHIEPFDPDRPAEPQNALTNLMTLCHDYHVEQHRRTTESAGGG